MHCESVFGASWAYDRGRWDTLDGWVPVRVVWAYFIALQAVRARLALDTSRGINLAFASEDAGVRIRREASDQAFSPAE